MIPPFRVDMAGRSHWVQELTFSQSMQIAGLPDNLQEKRLTAMLRAICPSSPDPLTMTVQERYYLLLQYLAAQQDSLIGYSMNYSSYARLQHEPWRQSMVLDGITIHQMTGLQAEILEAACENSADWVLGVLAMQIEASELPHLDSQDQSSLANQLHERVKKIGAMPNSQVDHLYSLWLQAQDRMGTAVHLGIDGGGLIVYGGADDAPMRFCATAAFGFIAGQLAGGVDQDGFPDQPGGADQFG